MKRVTLEVEETVKYQSTVILNVPDELTDEELDRICTAWERHTYSIDELPYYLIGRMPEVAKHITLAEAVKRDLSSPTSSEVEIIEVDMETPHVVADTSEDHKI